MARSLSGLAGLYQAQAKYAEAEPLYQRSLKIHESVHGKDHADVAYPLLGLAAMEMDQARFDQAEPLIQRAIEIYRAPG